MFIVNCMEIVTYTSKGNTLGRIMYEDAYAPVVRIINMYDNVDFTILIWPFAVVNGSKHFAAVCKYIKNDNY